MFPENDPISSVQIDLSAALGIDLPRSAAELALKDPSFRQHLLISKSNPTWVGQLIALAESKVQTAQKIVPGIPTKELGLNAVSAMAKWALSGFETVDEDTFRRRWSSCQECSYLVTPPEKLIYHLGRRVVTGGGDQRVCELCGCFAEKKARLATEHCPSESPKNKGQNRWGEKIS